MAFDTRPNSLFDMMPSDLFKDFGRQIIDQIPSNSNMKTDIRELDDQFILQAELPGIEKSNIELQFEDNILTIHAKQQIEQDEKDENGKIIHQERRMKDMKRQFSFDNIMEDQITAAFENGILRVNLPKQPKETQKRTDIQID